MTPWPTERFYKPAYSHERSKQIIISLKETLFDPNVVDVFLLLEDEFNRIREEKLEEETELINQPAQAIRG